MANQDSTQNEKKKGLLGDIFKGDKKEKTNSSGCCNMKIVPKEQPAEDKKTDKGNKGGGCCGGGNCC